MFRTPSGSANICFIPPPPPTHRTNPHMLCTPSLFRPPHRYIRIRENILYPLMQHLKMFRTGSWTRLNVSYPPLNASDRAKIVLLYTGGSLGIYQILDRFVVFYLHLNYFQNVGKATNRPPDISNNPFSSQISPIEYLSLVNTF